MPGLYHQRLCEPGYPCRMPRWSIPSALLSCLLLSGCAHLIQPGPAHVDWAQQSRSGTTLEELEAARERFITTCTRCHVAKAATRYEPDRWDFAIRRMLAGEDVSISDEVIAEVVLYLGVASALPTRRAVAAWQAEHAEAEAD
jgi:hypothetical protein